MQIEAETVARVLYGTARNNTREQQEAVVWCIINRMESALYPDTIEGVCRQEGQWMGYSDSNPVMEDLYPMKPANGIPISSIFAMGKDGKCTKLM